MLKNRPKVIFCVPVQWINGMTEIENVSHE